MSTCGSTSIGISPPSATTCLEMDERKNASLSDEIRLDVTQLETMPFESFEERLHRELVREDGYVDVRRHSHRTMNERSLGAKDVPVQL